MDVLLDDDERMIADQARSFLAAACSPALVRSSEAQRKMSEPLWQEMLGLGWLDTCLPEACGGMGMPLPTMTLLFEEVGRHLAPVPLLSATVVSLVIARHGAGAHVDWLARMRQGEVPSLALQEEQGTWSAGAVRVSARREGEHLVLDGTKMFVDDFGLSTRCLVACRLQGAGPGLTLALVDPTSPGITATELVPTAKDSQACVQFASVRVPLSAIIGRAGEADAAVREAMDLATLFGTAQMVGAARRANEMAVDYATQRVAFGQPIGSFQSIQHACADALIGIDGAQLLCREAAWKMAQGRDAAVEVSQAKAFANDKCVAACRNAQQIHGGIGFMMEFDLQLWYRRVVSWSLRHGTTSEHRRRVSDHLLARRERIRLDRPMPAGVGRAA